MRIIELLTGNEVLEKMFNSKVLLAFEIPPISTRSAIAQLLESLAAEREDFFVKRLDEAFAAARAFVMNNTTLQGVSSMEEIPDSEFPETHWNVEKDTPCLGTIQASQQFWGISKVSTRNYREFIPEHALRAMEVAYYKTSWECHNQVLSEYSFPQNISRKTRCEYYHESSLMMNSQNPDVLDLKFDLMSKTPFEIYCNPNLSGRSRKYEDININPSDTFIWGGVLKPKSISPGKMQHRRDGGFYANENYSESCGIRKTPIQKSARASGYRDKCSYPEEIPKLQKKFKASENVKNPEKNVDLIRSILARKILKYAFFGITLNTLIIFYILRRYYRKIPPEYLYKEYLCQRP